MNRRFFPVGRGFRFWVVALGVVTLASAQKPAVIWTTTAIGLCEDYPEETRTLAHAKSDLTAARAAGAQVLRIAFGWDSIEAQRGHYDWSFWDDYVRMATDDFGIRLIPYVCYTPKWAASDPGENYWRSPPRDPADFARFVGVLVRHYHDRIHSWELWNEPDNQAYWLGTTQQFGALVRAGSGAIRAADPQATIVLGGIAGELDFLTKLLRDEHVGSSVDVINIHSYFETWHPSTIEGLPRYIDAAGQIVHDAGGHQPLWMAETGYSSVGARAEISSSYRSHFQGEHSETAQAGALARTVLLSLATQKLGVIAWYRINDLVAGQEVIGDDNNRYLGLRHVDGTPKPAYATFSFLAHLFGQPYASAAAEVAPVSVEGAAPVVRSFALRDGRRVVAAWLAMPKSVAPAQPSADRRAATLRITLPRADTRAVTVRDATGGHPPVDTAGWRIEGDQVVLTWRLRADEVLIGELSP